MHDCRANPDARARRISFLDAAFLRSELRERNSTKKAPDVFRFDSTRWIGRISEGVAVTLAPGAESVLFEVQVPTVFEHAWAVVTHDLVYKSDDIDWRKARLAAQLKASVEQLELFIAAFEQNVDFVPRSAHPVTDAKAELIAGMKSRLAAGRMTAELAPRSWSRFAENVFSLVTSYTPDERRKPAAMAALQESIEQLLDTDDRFVDLRSGSLFQVFLGHVAGGAVDGASIDSFVVVDSDELRDFHGLAVVPKAFIF